MSILEKLNEGIVSRDLSKESHAIVNKWEKTGLLEGLTNDTKRTNMACLLENQAKELLRESSSMQAGDVEGFAAVAFPIVRRVFAGLIANDLVSVQPMSLPSGLIFFLDFTKDRARLGDAAGDSVYGGGAVANQITGGVSLTGDDAEKSFYNLNNGYSSPTGSGAAITITDVLSGTVGGPDDVDAALEKILRFDPDIASGTAAYVGSVAISDLDQVNLDDLVTLTVTLTGDGRQARRLTQLSGTAGTDLLIVIAASGSESTDDINPAAAQAMSWAQVDDFTNGGALG